MKNIKSFIANKIYDRLRFIRYPVNYLDINEKNLKRVKKISERVNFKEKKLRSLIPDLNYFNFSELESFNKNGFLILKKDRLNKIDGFEKIFNNFSQNFEKLNSNNKFEQKKLFKIYKHNITDNNEIKSYGKFFLPIVSNYLNLIPILTTAVYWLSEADNLNKNFTGSQLPHFDWEDLKQVKIFLSFDDISYENGPLHILPKKESFEINEYKKQNMLNGFDDIDYLTKMKKEIEDFAETRPF